MYTQSRAGSYSVVMTKSRRNHREKSLIGTSRLEAIQDMCRNSTVLKEHAKAIDEEAGRVSVMTKGFRINGRKYSQGDQVICVKS